MIRQVLRLWLRGEGLRAIERLALDRRTVRRYLQAAVDAGLVREGGEEQLTDELLGAVVEAVRPARPRDRRVAWEVCEAERIGSGMARRGRAGGQGRRLARPPKRSSN